MNIYEKLFEIKKTVNYFKKDKEGQLFPYVSSELVLGSIREKMNEVGVLLIPDLTEAKATVIQKENKHAILTEVWIKYTWVSVEDPTDKMECNWYGQGTDPGERGVGKAYTYNEKYFILKFFNIPTGKDDPDGLGDNVDKPVRKADDLLKDLYAIGETFEKTEDECKEIAKWFQANTDKWSFTGSELQFLIGNFTDVLFHYNKEMKGIS